MNEGQTKQKKQGKNPQKKTEAEEAKKSQNFSLCWWCCCFCCFCWSKKTEEEASKKKPKLHKKKERRDRVKIIMSADELKQRGNEAFKVNDFKLACELFTEAITLDSTNHVLYSNRSAARVIFIMYFLCIQLYTFSKRFSIVFICLRLLFLRKE